MTYVIVACNRKLLQKEQRKGIRLSRTHVNSLYVMDCNMLAKIADVLGHKEEQEELLSRGKKYSENLSRLWDEHDGMYYNMHTDTNKFNYRTSPTNFYPLLVDHPSSKQADKIVKKHLLNPEEFWGQYVIPSTPHNDPAFKDNNYWRGRVWGPLNFLVYKGLANYDTPLIKKTRKEFAEKSKNLFLKSWFSNGYVFENYNATNGVGDDVLGSDKFYHWGALLGYIDLLEHGF